MDTVGFRDGMWADFYGSPLHLGLDLELLEFACLENEKDVPRLVGK